MPKVRDLTGKRFGRLRVESLVGVINRNSYWLCLCDCGSKSSVCACHLASGKIQSCGCYQKEACSLRTTTHGVIKSGKYKREYFIWKGIISRCTDKENAGYKDYGGRGIAVCDRWMDSVLNFIQDMGPRPDGTSVDRINNDGNYEPSNCRWADKHTQANNTRRNKFIEFCGKVQTVSQWGRELRLSPSVIASRLRIGWSLDRAFYTPVRIAT